jgi:Holliday junction resolvase
MDVKFERMSQIAVSRGLLVVRYASSGTKSDFPVAFVKAAPECEELVEVISAPGATEGRLDVPGDSLVVRVQDTARIEIGLRRVSPTGSLDASFQIDMLGGGKLPEAVPANAVTVAEPIQSAVVSDFRDTGVIEKSRSPRSRVSLLAHVAMRGDVEGREDRWIAGPGAPAPIEGIAIRSENPAIVGVETQVLVAGSKQWSDWAPTGAFAGTRGRGLPLVGVRLRVTGSEAPRTELAAEALFLGATAVAKSGRLVEFANSTGSDPLVGIKIGMRTTVASPDAVTAEGSWRDRGSKVRVFRSSAGA